MRNVFLALLTANLLFLAWALWIDAPRDSGAPESLSRLPRLQLVSESPAGSKPTAARTAIAVPGVAIAEKTSLRIAAPPQSCTSFGPFKDIPSAARAAGLLTRRGFHLQQRAEEGETIEGYWVFVDGLQSDEDVRRLIDRLGKSGFTDAQIMKNYSNNRRVSVGMFRTRERAERRAAAVKNMGLQSQIGERKFPGSVYWVDVTLETEAGAAIKQLPPEYAFADIGHSKVQMQPCPRNSRAVEPATSAGVTGDAVSRALPRTAVAGTPLQH